MKAVMSKALVEFGVDREIIGKAYREYRKTEREREAERLFYIESSGHARRRSKFGPERC